MLKKNKIALYFIILALVLILVYVLLKSDLSQRLAGDILKNSQNQEDLNEEYLINSFAIDKNIVNSRPADLILSSNKGAMRVLIYEDYANIFSAQLAKTVDKLNEVFSKDISISLRPFIMPGSLESQNNALVVICAKDMDKGLEMRNKFWESFDLKNSTNQNIELDLISDLAALDLDQDKFMECLDSESKFKLIDNLKQEAKQNLILGAPTIVVLDERVDGARPFEDFIDSNGDKIEGLESLIKRKLKK